MMITILLALFCVFIAYYKWKQQYWQRKGLQCIPGTIPFGSLPSPLSQTEHRGVTLKNYYLKLRSEGVRHIGLYLFASPQYLVLDLDYVKNIMAKDFYYFVDRGSYYNEKTDPISAHLFAIGGIKWKNLRAKLTPTFTSGKMKMMFPTMVECVSPMIESLEKCHKTNSPVDIKEVLGCFTTDIIGSCAFGLEFNTFSEENSPFRVHGKRVFSMTLSEQMKLAFCVTFSDLARLLGLRRINKDISEFFTDVVRNTINFREKNNYRRADFMQLLIDMKNKTDGNGSNSGITLTFEEIAAQAFVFFLAGFETSSTAMTFALYEMALNKEIQNKARTEVNNVLNKYNEEITYESLKEMKYLEQIVEETLRKYPPIAFLTRVCVKDYKVPDTDLIIEKGTGVLLPVMGIHYDPEYWAEPDTFDPERFNDERKQNNRPYSYLPFGEGPRLCIGLRFGLMQAKVGLVSLLRKYKFDINAKTSQPIEFDKKSFSLAAKGDIWLDIDKV